MNQSNITCGRQNVARIYFIAARAEARQFSGIQDPGTSGLVSFLFLLAFSFVILLTGFLRKNASGI